MGDSANEYVAWQQFANLLHRLPAALETHLQRTAQLTHFEYRLLEIVHRQPHRRMQLSALAAASASSLSRLSRVVTTLSRRELLVREAIDGARGTYAVLTDAGEAKVEAAAPAYRELVAKLVFTGLTRDGISQLRRLSAEINGRAIAHTQLVAETLSRDEEDEPTVDSAEDFATDRVRDEEIGVGP